MILCLLGELAAAIRNNTDIHFGLYYSLFEWFHPLFLQDKANNFQTNTYVTVCIHPVYVCTVYVYTVTNIGCDATTAS